MKRILTILLILICLLLSACCKHDSDSISRSQNIFSSGENYDFVKKPVRMLKAEGKLYYDSGKISDTSARCGTFDGELRQIGAEHEIPKKNNTCNFKGAAGYQNTTSITKEALIDGKWVIFKLFDDPELDMNVFDYCFYLKGRLPNAQSDSEIIALTQDINYDFSDYAKLTVQSKAPASLTENNYLTTFRVYGDTDKWGISLSSENVTDKGLILLIEQFGGSPSGELQTGTPYSLEVNKNGKWIFLDVLDGIDYGWDDVAYEIKKNDITGLTVNWEGLYGRLPSGFYRLNKKIMNFKSAGDFEEEDYSLYFTID